MNTQKGNKINQLLIEHTKGTFELSSSLNKRGISYELQRRYIKSGWFERIARGVLRRKGETVTWYGALHSLHYQSKKQIHIGGITALALSERLHFLQMKEVKVYLFGGNNSKPPKWFFTLYPNKHFIYTGSNFLPPKRFLKEIEINGIPVLISSPIRAFMECLYSAKSKDDLISNYQIMQGLRTLIPKDVEEVLKASKSVVVNRLFLFMAYKANHIWYKKIDKEKIFLGAGKRSLIKGGKFVTKFDLVLPKEIV